MECDNCGGTGKKEYYETTEVAIPKCSRCNGTGEIPDPKNLNSSVDFSLDLLNDLKDWQQPNSLMKDIVKDLADRYAEMNDRIGISILMDYLGRDPSIKEVATHARFSHRMNSGYVSFSWHGEEIARVSRPVKEMNYEGTGPNSVSLGTAIRMEIDLSYREDNDIQVMSSWDYKQWADKQKQKLQGD